eukprot:11815693-Alexandrium_andersonii.AAC.1
MSADVEIFSTADLFWARFRRCRSERFRNYVRFRSLGPGSGGSDMDGSEVRGLFRNLAPEPGPHSGIRGRQKSGRYPAP